MKDDKRLELLFKEINIKPKDLDRRVMSEIYKQAELKKMPVRADLKSWTWTYILIGILFVCGLGYVIYTINFLSNTLIWMTALAVLVPVILDKILMLNAQSKNKFI